jgi:hypothetical protein
MKSTAVWNLKSERWGSALVQEKYQEEKACDKRQQQQHNNNNNNHGYSWYYYCHYHFNDWLVNPTFADPDIVTLDTFDRWMEWSHNTSIAHSERILRLS